MSVPVSQRKESKLEVLIKALAVANYTNGILANRKKFPEEYDHVLGDDLKRAGQGIYRYCRQANNLRAIKPVSQKIDPEAREARYRLQTKALENCNELLVLIDMAYGTYHLSSKRVEYWSRLTRDARELIRKWRAADVKRYGKP